MKGPAAQTALNSGSDALPGWSSHIFFLVCIYVTQTCKEAMCGDINGIAIRAVVAKG